MKVNKFRIGQRVKVKDNGANASQFNSGKTLRGIYVYPDWESRIFVIEGTVKLTSFKDTEAAPSAHLLTNIDGSIVGYVYSDAIINAEEEWSYSLTTNIIWFGQDFGRVKAASYEEAKRLAQGALIMHVEKMNSLLDGLDRIDINVDEVSIKKVNKVN